MTESQNISFNRPVGPKPHSSSQPEIQRQARPEEQEMEAGTRKKQRKQSPLELYGGAGKIRNEQPAARGNNIDITV